MPTLHRSLRPLSRCTATVTPAATAMCLVLLPVAMVVAGLWMGIAGLITGVQ